ncbi:class I SAM-dependent methyltransferase [Sphingomonas profundi]|uniref:class I SAM-dependent methyltransferase n=1 Tax=Alterirhizorhabdus profundi TaxID=2681549 RepID=UPI0012E734E5|nr:class I SAM-dependent methyltransferase [Sphingomonas profundi]
MVRGAGSTAILLFASLASCGSAKPRTDADVSSRLFPEAHRPVAPIVSSRFSTEEDRDRIREAGTVMDKAGIARGMTVADIGAGEGYYTVRLAQRVGKSGRVLAEDIVPAVRDTLAERATRERLDNVSVRLGSPADPKLPANSFDRVFMVHMYHEIAAPYEFLWRLRPSLRNGGRIVLVDADRPTSQHGTPPALLDCEMRAVGYTRVTRMTLRAADAYLALYEAAGPRPAPETIVPCTMAGTAG